MLFAIPAQIGYGALFGPVLAESAGVPVPGETALLAAGALAGSAHLVLPLVIAVGTVAAIRRGELGGAQLRRSAARGHRRRPAPAPARTPQPNGNLTPPERQRPRIHAGEVNPKEPHMSRSTLRQFLDRPGALLAASLAIALVVGLLTSSLLGFGVFLVVPSLVARLLRR
jgi:hypothetical protein